MRGANQRRRTKSDSFLSGNDGRRLNLRFQTIRKGLFRFNPLPTSTLKSRGGVHGIRPRPSKRTSWSPICSWAGVKLPPAIPSPLPRGRGRGEGCNHSRPTKSDSLLSGNDGWRLNLRFHSIRKGQFQLNPLPTSALKSRGGVHAIRPRPPNQTSSFTKYS